MIAIQENSTIGDTSTAPRQVGTRAFGCVQPGVKVRIVDDHAADSTRFSIPA